MDAAVAFARNIIGTKYEEIPAEVIAVIRQVILDSLGVSAAGSSAPGVKELAAMVKGWGGKAESTIIGHKCRVPAPDAAMVNGAMIRILDYNETDEEARTHPAVPIIPAAFAVAEQRGGVSGKEFLAGVALAFDMHSRMLRAVPEPGHWLPAQVGGFFAAAAVVGRLMGMDEETLLSAFGLALAQTSGSRQATTQRAMVRGFQGAFAAKGGVLAALMAQEGITGPADSIEGQHGFYQAYFNGDYSRNILLDGLGKKFYVAGLSFKAYPSCRQSHPSIDATLEVVRAHDLKPEEVAAVTVFVGNFGQTLCEPLESCRSPQTITEGQFSIPYNVAVAIVNRNVTLNDYIGDAFRAPAVLEMAQKISYQPEATLNIKGIQPGMVEIKTKDGRKLRSRRIDKAKGHPENPLTRDELAAKFTDCVRHAATPIPPNNAAQAIKLVSRFEKLADVSEVVRLLA